MGKKSKKGQSRAGNKKHNKAGAAKSSATKSRLDGSDVVSVESSDRINPTNVQAKATNNTGVMPADLPTQVKAPANGTAKTREEVAAAVAAALSSRELEIPPPPQVTEKVPDKVVDDVVAKAAEDALKEAEDLLEEGEKLKSQTPAVSVEESKPKTKESAAPEPVVEKIEEPEPVVEPPKEVPAPAPAPVMEKPKETMAPTPEPVVKAPVPAPAKAPATKAETPKEVPAPQLVVEKPKEAPKAEPAAATKSRGLALDEPAPEEAAAKQKDCECIIL